MVGCDLSTLQSESSDSDFYKLAERLDGLRSPLSPLGAETLRIELASRHGITDRDVAAFFGLREDLRRGVGTRDELIN